MIKRALLAILFGGCLVATGMALSPSDNIIIILPKGTVVTTPPVGSTLQTLTSSANTFAVGNPQGTVIGNVLNTTAGSTVAFNSLSVVGSLQLVNVVGVWQIQVGPSAPGVASSITFNLVESLPGATNTPKTTSGFVVTETSTVALQALALSGNTFTVGNPQGTVIGNVLNTTAGSTVTFNSLSVANSLQLASVGGGWQIQVGSSPPGSATALTFNLVEALTGASNTPLTTSGFVVNEVSGGNVKPPVPGEAITVSLNKTNNQNNGSFVLGGTVPTLSFHVTGTNPNYSTYVSYTISDENSNVIAGPIHVPISTDGSGNANPAAVNAPASKLGYYRIDAQISSGTTMYPTGQTLGTRPPGFSTYAVMNNPDSRFTYAASLTRFGLEDILSGGSATSLVPSSTLAYLGVRWVGSIQQQWVTLEPNGPNTFSGNLSSHENFYNNAATTPTNAHWNTYTLFYFTATHTPGWAKGSPCAGNNNSDFCALNGAGVSELPNFAQAYATAAHSQYSGQDRRYYQITWEAKDIGGLYPPLLQYYQLAYGGLHAGDPQAIVVGPTMFISSENILIDLNNAGNPPFGAVVDGFSMHNYSDFPQESTAGYWNHTYPSTPNNITGLTFVHGIRDYKSIMKGFKGFDVPFIGTEQGDKSEAMFSPFNRANRADVDKGLLWQAQGDVRRSIIWLGEGAAFDSLFKVDDFWFSNSSPTTDPGSTWGVYFNLDSNTPGNGNYGSTALGPKPAAPAYSALTWILDGLNNSNGVISGLTGTQNGYSFTRTVHDPKTIWALWDWTTTSTANISIPAGAYKLCDWMGNCTSKSTAGGGVSVALTANPVYIIQ